MATRCTKHSFEVAVAQCRSCSEPFCDDCLVYTYGPSSPPFCVPCALVAAGVRRVTGAEKKALRASKGKKVELDPTARSLNTLTVDVVPAVAPTAGAVVTEAEDVAAGDGGTRVPLAWVAIVVGVVLLLVPFVASNV